MDFSPPMAGKKCGIQCRQVGGTTEEQVGRALPMKMLLGMGVVSVLGLAGAGCITSIHWGCCGGLQGAEVGCFCEGLQGTTTMFHSRVYGTPLGPHSPIPRLWQDQSNRILKLSSHPVYSTTHFMDHSSTEMLHRRGFPKGRSLGDALNGIVLLESCCLYQHRKDHRMSANKET